MSGHASAGWVKSGAPWVWLSAGSVSISLVVVFGLLLLIAVRGLGYFWPSDLVQFKYRQEDGSLVQLLGEFRESEEIGAERLRESGQEVPAGREAVTRYLVKIGNREIGNLDFRWVIEDYIYERKTPADALVIERREWGNFHGVLRAVKENGNVVAQGTEARAQLAARLDRANALHERIRHIEKDQIGEINYALEKLRLEDRGLELEGKLTPGARAEIERRRQEEKAKYQKLQGELDALYAQVQRDAIAMETSDGREVEIPLDKVVRVYAPNEMSVFGKSAHYVSKLWEFLSEEPREANTEGGIFPAIFGTVLMVMIMSVLVTPFGIVAAVYLREYAKQGPLTRIIRIAVNNLAGVPAIVYGVFGLGFFVYFVGGNIDRWFFTEALPAPTFGTAGILWASLTLAILTLPVVIVATEEGLSRIPRSVREGSLALGATKAETLWRIVLPMASPALMTGLILAVARAAGEVAPLMLVGVVKLAPSLPLDDDPPFLHLDRKFMHLGFHIHDVGFQSPNVDAARPLVYATALLLVGVIVALNIAAIAIRNRLREKYKTLES